MRTTIELPDELLAAAKSRAALDGVSLKDFFIAALRRQLGAPARKGRRPVPILGGAQGPAIADVTRDQVDEALFG